MPQVELVYFDGCPNLPEAREELRAAMGRAGLPPIWTEWNLTDPAIPERVLGYASPTVLVDGADVAGGCREVGLRCAVDGAPAAEAIRRALSDAPDGRTHLR